jgi:hypothetical protein
LEELFLVSGRTFQFVDEAYEGVAPAISCDGLVPGAALDLTHWQGNHTPRRYKADTSTETALNFVAAPEAAKQWADAIVVNNHFDTDGILSIWVLLDPERATANRELLVAAAEAGDFDEWPLLEQGLWLDAAIRALGSSAGDDEEAYRTVLPELPELIRRLETRNDLWGAEWDELQRAAAALESGILHAERIGLIGLLTHAPGQPEVPGPLLARRFLPGMRRYLLAFEREDGWCDYRYERPHYAWAETIVRPPLPAPEAGALIALLGPDWTDEGLPGMTGIIRTRRPIAQRTGALASRLAELDQGACPDAPSSPC